MSYLEELLPEFRNGAKIRRKDWVEKVSENKPQVGDIWEIYDPNAGTYKAIVINTSDFVNPYCITEDFQGAFLWGYTTETYIGKSKANINDLFEIRE